MSTNEIVRPEFTRNQRVVFEHRKGPLAGLFQILGHTDQFDGQQPPAVSDLFTAIPDHRHTVAGLVNSNPRYLLYREIDTPPGLADPGWR